VPKKKDYHRPSRTVRIPERLARLLDQLSDKNLSNLTQEAVRAIREYLERNSLWPPKNNRR
jgi:hypothetical protein